MIEILKDRGFHLQTRNTSYIFRITESGYPEHVYYGKRLTGVDSYLDAIGEKHHLSPVFSVYADRKYPEYSLSDTLLEFSTEGKGDYRTPFIAISYGERGERTANFKFSGYRCYQGICKSQVSLPHARATDLEADTLELSFIDQNSKLELVLFYTTFNDADAITRQAMVKNNMNAKATIRAIASSQLDFRAENVRITSFQGDWARERHIKTDELSSGTYSIESRGLDSSAQANPAFILQSNNDTYLMNLVYSGPHRASVSITSQNMVHAVWGINPDMFSWPLSIGETFMTPEAVMIYSPNGLDGVRDLSHRFIQNHISRGFWKNKYKPLMFNTWEGSYFDIDEVKVAAIANTIKELDFDGIVIDDGWFGARSDDTTSLGDWDVDSMKFPSGLSDIAAKVHHHGLLFGLWIEPESISEKSILAKKHPDWIIGRDIKSNAEGRHQQLLDLTRDDVQRFIIDKIVYLINITHLTYLKWDMNRRYSDLFSHMEIQDYGMYAHKYMMGLYSILGELTRRFPSLYIEGCASGGARFDLGMLSFCPSIWTSDCSDAIERLEITEGTSLVYPLSVMGVSISPSPNAHTLRSVSLTTRLNTALFGVMSFSIDGNNIDSKSQKVLLEYIRFYKNYRNLLQMGRFRVQERGNRRIWTVSNPDSSIIIALYLQKEVKINTTAEKLYIECANEEYFYNFYSLERPHDKMRDFKLDTKIDRILGKGADFSEEAECYPRISGKALKWAGISLYEQFSGNGYKPDAVRVLGDYSTRIYIIKKVD